MGEPAIGPMHLIEVDHVGAQAPQRILDLLHDPLPAGVAERLAVAPVEADLGRDHRATAPAVLRERLAQNFFGPAETVDRRRIEQRDAAIERFVNGPDRLLLVGSAPHPAPDCPCSQSDPGDHKRRVRNREGFHEWRDRFG